MAKPENNKFTAEQVIEAIYKANGIMATTAKILGCSRQTVYNYIQRYKTVANAYNDASEIVLDFAENELLKQIQAGNITAIIYFLKTKGKHRGYVERQEISMPEDIKISVDF